MGVEDDGCGTGANTNARHTGLYIDLINHTNKWNAKWVLGEEPLMPRQFAVRN